METYFNTTITRKPGRNVACGLTSSKLEAPDYQLVARQYSAYVETLEAIGLEVIVLDEQQDYPDAYFVEDTAVVTPDVAVIARPGANTRRGEEVTIAPVLARYRKTTQIVPPGTLDGGDVLMVGNHFFIGLSGRTNKEGAKQLGSTLEEYGHTWEAIPAGSSLHLKSSVNYLGNKTLIVTEELADKEAFDAYGKIIVDADEAYAANTLWINDHILTPKGFPNTRKKLGALGHEIIELEMSEVRKMDGGLTCLSIRF